MLHDGNGGLIGSRYILVIGGLHLELLHTLLGLGDVQLVGRIVAHDRSLLLSFGTWVPWEYYVPEKACYDWRVTERVGMAGNSERRALAGWVSAEIKER